VGPAGPRAHLPSGRRGPIHNIRTHRGPALPPHVIPIGGPRPPQNQKCTGASPHCLIIVWLRASDRGRGLGPGAVMLTELSYLVPDTVASEVTAITAALTNGPRDSPKAEGTHQGRIGGGGFSLVPQARGTKSWGH